MKIFLFCLAALLFFPAPGGAADLTVTPDALQGVWSSPDCTAADKVWIISKYFFIHTAPGEVSVGPIRRFQAEESREDRFYALDTGGKNSILVNLTNDGLMKTTGTDIAADQPLSSQRAADAVAEEYSHCAKLFDHRPALRQREVNSIFLLDQARESCAGVLPENFGEAVHCQEALFNLADSDANDLLSREELMQLHRQFEFLQAGGPFCPDSPRFYPTGSARSLAFADTLLLKTGGRITFVDLVKLFGDGSPDSAGIPLQDLKIFLPFLPGPNSDVLCDTTSQALPVNNKGGSPKQDAPRYQLPNSVRP